MFSLSDFTQNAGAKRGFACLTKKDLLEKAKYKKIPGVWKMTKEQLVQALRSQPKTKTKTKSKSK
jgi:hypothetical protein